MNIDERKNQITFLIKKYYYENEFLKGKSLDKFLNKAYEKFLYSDLSINDIESEIIKAIERKKKLLQLGTNELNQTVPISSSDNVNDDDINILHNSGYANSLAITTMTLISFIVIMIIYVLLCIIF